MIEVLVNNEWVEGQPVNDQRYKETKTSGAVIESVWYKKDLQEEKAERKNQVKKEARERIESLAWQIERADRHDALGKPKKKDKVVVYQEQQDIEEASDLAELAIDALTDVDQVKSFAW